MKAAVLGAGLMGRAIVYDLCKQSDVSAVTLFDIDQSEAEAVAKMFGDGKAQGLQFDASNPEQANPFSDVDVVISAVTYAFNPHLTAWAIEAGAHFFDLGGNNDVVAKQYALSDKAQAADVCVIPDCGLAPGMVSVLVAGAINELAKTTSVKIRVGGLPQEPRLPLNYQMVFSAEGLINEYWEPVVILEDGQLKTVPPMSAIESLEFDGLGDFEAFYTSGGTSTLPKTYADSVNFLDYKTIRYPGHCQLFKPMLEIGLASRDKINVDGQQVEPRAVFKEVLNQQLSFDEPDLVLVRVDSEGELDGKQVLHRQELIARFDDATGLTAMMQTTAFPIAIIAHMAGSGQISARGVVPQELAVDHAAFVQAMSARGLDITKQVLPL